MAGTFGTANTNQSATTGTLVPISKGRGNIPLPPDNLSHYDAKQLIQLAYAAGFPNAALAAAVAMAESSGDPTATNQDSNGSTDTGLWQINSVHGYNAADLKDPYYNVSAAKQVYDSSGWGAWSTINDGSAITHYYTTEPLAIQMGIPLKDTGSIGTGATGLANSVAPIGQAAVGGASSILGGLGNIAGLIGNLTSGSFWFMVLKILGGLTLIVIGAILLLKGSGTNINLPKVPIPAE